MQSKTIRVKYDDGEEDVFIFGEEYTVSSGINITQRIVTHFKLNDRVKKGDVICYNSEFFQKDPYSNQVDWKHGINANVVLIENDDTLEDSNSISKKLSEKLTISPVQMRTINISKDAIIYDIVNIGDVVTNTDNLLVFEESDVAEITQTSSNDAVLDILSKINRRTPKAHYAGKIVKIDVYYSCPVDSCHPSIQKVLKPIIQAKNRKYEYTKNSSLEFLSPPSVMVAPGTKLKKTTIDADQVVLQFYIQEDVGAGVGDKLVYDSSLKSIISNVFDEDIKTESGVEIDATFSMTSISNRIILSPLLVGIGQRILEKMQESVLHMWKEYKKQ